MKPTGIYVSPTQYVSFAETRTAPSKGLSDHIATRERSPDFRALGMYLPNPDPILKKMGRDISVYSDLRSTASVGGAIRRRKAGVLQMEHRVERGKASARMAKLVEESLSGLDMRNVLAEMLDAPLFGWNPMEVIWFPPTSGGPIKPKQLLAKPHGWFHFGPDAQLRFRSREAPMLGEEVAPRKFLVPSQDASYANPYGFADLSMVFWPTTFLRGGLKFWTVFTEKFGMPWLVGKTPRGTPKAEQDALLDQLETMVQDAVAVIPDDASIDTLKADGKTGSADLYERLLMFCRSEIAIALLGQNQTTEKDSTNASATAGAGVTDVLRDGDARLCEAALNQLARWIVDLNEGEAAPAPKVELFEQEQVDKLQAERDEILTRAGVKLTRAYFMRTYDLGEGDIEQAAPPPTAPTTEPAGSVMPTDPGSVAFAETEAQPTWAADAAALAVHSAPSWAGMVAKLQTMVDASESLDALQQDLVDAYGGLDSAELVKLIAAAMALAELKGMADAQDDGAT